MKAAYKGLYNKPKIITTTARNTPMRIKYRRGSVMPPPLCSNGYYHSSKCSYDKTMAGLCWSEKNYLIADGLIQLIDLVQCYCDRLSLPARNSFNRGVCKAELAATTSPVSSALSREAKSETKPPASLTSRIPAATSHRLKPRSQ